jgi:glycosyltransferase involved in cell wall biosynthesis
MIGRATSKVDLHLHSYASNVTDYFAANSLAIPESYSDPRELYRRLKAEGMGLVTITDHNSIDGVKELQDAGYPDVFASAEFTTTFPEDGCNIHITVANITEGQFAELNRLRRNIYEMVAYLDDQMANEGAPGRTNRIVYFMTHPLMSTQNRTYGREGSLQLMHLEKVLLLCNCFEVRNGTRTRALNEFTEQWIRALDRETIERLADRHGIAPKGEQPWRKSVVAGSDDHSGINPGRTWTEIPQLDSGRLTPNDLVDAIRAGRSAPAGSHGGPVTLAHAMLKLMHDGNRLKTDGTKRRGQRSTAISGPIESLLGLAFGFEGSLVQRAYRSSRTWVFGEYSRWRTRRPGVPSFELMLAAEVKRLLADRQFRSTLASAGGTDERVFAVISSLVNRLLTAYAAGLGREGNRDVLSLAKQVIALASSNLLVSMPYLVSYFHQSSDKLLVGDVRRATGMARGQRLVLVTDTYFEVNGVGRTIRRMQSEAKRRGIQLVVVTCLDAKEIEQRRQDPEVRALIESGELRLFPAVVRVGMPGYQGLHLHVPPFLEMLKFIQEEGFDRMQISTPGSVGLAGLLAAKVLQLETSSTYHTSFPEYVESYTQDISLEALTWKCMVLFYHSVDEVVVPSAYIAKLLHARGLRKKKLLVLDRWVDLERFHPRHRVAGFWERFGLRDAEKRVLFIYLGRVSLEKNLDLLADAYRRLVGEDPRAHLIFVGDGPYLEALRQRLADLPVTFTGALEGHELAQAIASADAKLFPSTTDTWGNAPLEAQASGLPVVVSDCGGPQELMQHGRTGLRIPGRDVEALYEAMVALMDDGLRREMGLAAREFVEARRVDRPFSAILESDEYRRRSQRRKGVEPVEEQAAAEPPELIADYPLELDLELLPRRAAVSAQGGLKVGALNP